VSEANGAKPPFDPSQLTPNDLRRLRVALDGRNPQELLGGAFEDVFQATILAHKLRTDPGFSWEQAGDVSPSEVFDMSGGEPPPPTPPGEQPGSVPSKPGGSVSRKKRTASAPAPGSAASTASPPPSTTT
jgi:hypothetical protein